MPDITIKMLYQQLKELEVGKCINRKDFKTIPPKVEYSITSLGKSLRPIINKIEIWGIKNKKHIDLTLNKLGKFS